MGIPARFERMKSRALTVFSGGWFKRLYVQGTVQGVPPLRVTATSL
jgi:hypothetical protein